MGGARLRVPGSRMRCRGERRRSAVVDLVVVTRQGEVSRKRGSGRGQSEGRSVGRGGRQGEISRGREGLRPRSVGLQRRRGRAVEVEVEFVERE
ncbi:hypothetical protein D8674_024087 [Pyrus ussuriensis x Pyrus communis]|uniref:Uncharacterized protein n=1 Tax=Pyrus ussuriensis x Pyrus communis TaxID=2448454 RepID=A0A5N5H1Z0_9ROSA|nr:hypothetical protein D8674_024087 [Pyrus ussuriensis x Pyrus communis]